MKSLILEPVGGISGDMLLGAAADLGLDLTDLERLLGAAQIVGFRLRAERAFRGGIGGTLVRVEIPEPDRHGHGQRWPEIRTLLGHPTLGEIGRRAARIFARLAKVEAQIHGVDEETVHFHEVGALDSIVDIVGAAWALDRLGAERIYSRPPPLGSGVVQSEHGAIPVPAPATLALLQGKPTLWEGIGERTTPTGAAILAECASFEIPVHFVPERIGYGVGHADWVDRPNLLRATLGTEGPALSRPEVGILEAHLDDATPQLLGHLVERLIERGALDACIAPIIMKKGRPGQRLTVVCREADRAALSEFILRESPSLGVRWSEVVRDELDRRTETVETEFGPVRVKLGLRGGEVWNVAPEYEDCVAVAQERAVPLKRVMASAAAVAQRLWSLKW